MVCMWILNSRTVVGIQELLTGTFLSPSTIKFWFSCLEGMCPRMGGNIKMSSHSSNFYEASPTLTEKLSCCMWLLHRWLPPTHTVQSWWRRFCPTFHWSWVILLHLFTLTNLGPLQALQIISLHFKNNLNFRYVKNLPLKWGNATTDRRTPSSTSSCSLEMLRASGKAMD